jgi:DNA-binding NarL/FixJ family response regulator
VPDTPLRVAVADDHYLVREGVRQLLELEPDLSVVASVATAEELLATVTETEVDVVVTDVRMPPGHGTEGIEAAHLIRAGNPRTGVVVLSAHAEASYALELFRDGTAGLAYLLKDRVGDRSELAAAVRATAAGQSVVDPAVVEAMVRRSSQRSALDALTPREREVLALMATGRSNPGIAGELYLSLSAVEKNVTSIFAKLGLTEERRDHRRVAAVLAFLGDRPEPGPHRRTRA